MNSKNASSNRDAWRRKPASGRSAVKLAPSAAVITALCVLSPLCSAPASAQLGSIGSNGNSGLLAQLSILQSFGSPLYLNLGGLGSQSVANFGLTQGSNGNLFGTTATGGLNNDGTVYEVSPAGQVQLLKSFGGLLGILPSGDGITPGGALTLGPDGNLYGVTTDGGTNGDGTVYQVTPAGVVTTLYSFTGGATGALPTGTLTIGSDGTITGTTTAGGTSNDGTVYQIANATTAPVETVLHSFAGGTSDGSDPVSGVIQAADGDLYGTTTGGGTAGDGTVFQIADTAGPAVESLVHSFTGGTADGSDPVGGLIQTASGALAGTTASGGSSGGGTIYQIADAGTQPVESVLSSLNSSTGTDPVSGLLQAPDGSLLGTAQSGGSNGGGTIFILLSNGLMTTMEDFTGNNGVVGSFLNNLGSAPTAPLTMGASNIIYGTTDSAGQNDLGSMYELALPSSVTGLTPTRLDLNGDGKADILFYNNLTGAIAYWLMDDADVLQYGSSFGSVAPNSGWIPVGEPDAAGNGQPDILFWNQETGAMSIWDLAIDSETVTSYGSTFATISDTDWVPSAIANDQNNGNYEIVFQNTATGDISAWQMNGTTVTSYGGTIASLGANSGWNLVGAPDVNGDGISDYLFWNSNNGDVSYWTMGANDTVAQFNTSFAQVSDTDWHLAGAPDLSGDGHYDLLWENYATGELSRWAMDGSSVTDYGGDFATTGPVATNGWIIQGDR